MTPRRLRASDSLARRALPPIAALFIRALRATITLRVHGRETIEAYARDEERYVHVFWHAHILLMVYSYVGPELVFMISRHRDGELIARTVERFGYVPARGSSTKGGSAALREMIRAIRRGADIGFTPDGPRGPARVAQPGAVGAARALGLPVVPVAIGATRAWRLDTWDRFVVPKPFSRVLMAYGEPLSFPREEPLEEGSARLGRALDELESFAALHAADPAFGKRP